MIQDINLLHRKRKEKKEALTALNIERIGVIFIAILMVFYIFSVGMRVYKNVQVSYLKETKAQKEKELNKAKIKAEDTRDKDALTTALRKSKNQNNRLLVIANILKKSQQEKISYSEYLQGLGKASEKGVWLSKFSILNAGNYINLQGHAAIDNLIPKFLENLKAQPEFSGRDFNNFVAQRSTEDERKVDFSIESTKIN